MHEIGVVYVKHDSSGGGGGVAGAGSGEEDSVWGNCRDHSPVAPTRLALIWGKTGRGKPIGHQYEYSQSSVLRTVLVYGRQIPVLLSSFAAERDNKHSSESFMSAFELGRSSCSAS